MSEHQDHPVVDPAHEHLTLGEAAWPIYNIAKIAGFVGIIGGVTLGFFLDPGFRRFYFAYLVSFVFFLSIALGALAFVLIQHLTKAGWSVSMRRVAECLAATMPILAVLSAPIVMSVLLNRGDLYRWAQSPLESVDHGDHTPSAKPQAADVHASSDAHAATTQIADAHHAPNVHPSVHGVPPLDALTLKKRAYLNRWFFTLRLAIYFVTWTGIAFFYWRRSCEQDKTGDFTLSQRMQAFAPPAALLLVITCTFAAIDLLMSLDPHWFSTMFGVYYLAGALLASIAAIILVIGLLHHLGYLRRSVNTEHFHDLGKWLFGFVFFWGYIAYSQYMLIWYASIPEETAWFARRGATTVQSDINGYSYVVIALLIGKLFIPFVGLMSKHAKRRAKVLMFFAAWVLVFHWVDMYWLVMPELDGRVHFGLVEILCFLGVGGVFMATYLRLLAKNPLRPIHDPRLSESLAFQNV
ncbi:MAG: quinol:cytochrome C oxidoreductase [Tepidisphaeraceae bacterium]